MYNTILFPTDGSDGAEAALEHAADVAARYDATLHVLYVAQDDFGPSGMVEKEHEGVERSEMVGGSELEQQRKERQQTGMTNKQHDVHGSVREHGQQVVDDAAETVGDDVAVETVVLDGNPYERILDYTEESDVDLVVMGTHGRTGVDRYLLGSVTEKVVRTSDVPVLTVRMDA